LTATLQACFFASAEQLRAYPGIARRIHGTGHTLGIFIEDNPTEIKKRRQGYYFPLSGQLFLYQPPGEGLSDSQITEAIEKRPHCMEYESATEYMPVVFTAPSKSEKSI
jgi:hypothetical protein